MEEGILAIIRPFPPVQINLNVDQSLLGIKLMQANGVGRSQRAWVWWREMVYTHSLISVGLFALPLLTKEYKVRAPNMDLVKTKMNLSLEFKFFQGKNPICDLKKKYNR